MTEAKERLCLVNFGFLLNLLQEKMKTKVSHMNKKEIELKDLKLT